MNIKFWWKCKHLQVDKNLGVAFCKKYNNFCLKRNCEELYDTKGKLQKELNTLKFNKRDD